MNWDYVIDHFDVILFDRNGTTHRTISGARFPRTVDDIEWIPGRDVVCRALAAAGKYVGLLTNQGGAAWGIFPIAAMERCLIDEIDEGGMQAFFVCYHDNSENAQEKARVRELVGPDLYNGTYERRKPGPGMLIEARADYIEWKEVTSSLIAAEPRILYVGDRPEDFAAAQAAAEENLLITFMWADDFFGGVTPPAAEGVL